MTSNILGNVPYRGSDSENNPKDFIETFPMLNQFFRRQSMSWQTMCFDIFIIVLGFMFAFVGMYYSAKALNKAFELGIPT